jgi:hypothetical protein
LHVRTPSAALRDPPARPVALFQPVEAVPIGVGLWRVPGALPEPCGAVPPATLAGATP